MNMLLRTGVVLCVGTCLTQLIFLGYFAAQGRLNSATVTKIVALLNGIDITGDRLQQILMQSEGREQPDFSEILEARKMESLDLDLRLRSQQEFRNELSLMLASLRAERKRFDERREAFDRRLKEIGDGARDEGLNEVQQTLQALDPDQAKEQLLKMHQAERIDDVVNILQAMPIDKRKDILAEFVTADEAEKLHEILRRIGEGLPTTSLIDQARGDR